MYVFGSLMFLLCWWCVAPFLLCVVVIFDCFDVVVGWLLGLCVVVFVAVFLSLFVVAWLFWFICVWRVVVV